MTTEEILAYMATEKDSFKDYFPRFGYRFALLLQHMLKFKTDWHHFEAYTYNDSTGGGLGDVIDGKADLFLSPMRAQIIRMQYAETVLEIGSYFKYVSFPYNIFLFELN